jgi:hypothetical protein
MALLYTWSLTAAQRSRQTKAPQHGAFQDHDSPRPAIAGSSLNWRNIAITLIEARFWLLPLGIACFCVWVGAPRATISARKQGQYERLQASSERR